MDNKTKKAQPKDSKRSKLSGNRVAVTVKKAFLTWINPETDNYVGYLRALQLHLTIDKNAEYGVLNPKTGNLVGLRKAIQMHLVPASMLKRVA